MPGPAAGTPALARPTGVDAAGEMIADADTPARSIDVQIEYLTLFLFRNDFDFDRSAPHYAPNGQSMGVLGTCLKPDFTVYVLPNLRLFYELEIGLNVWSQHNPDQQDASAADVFLMKHREIFAEGEVLGGLLGFKVGYPDLRRRGDPRLDRRGYAAGALAR